MSTKNYLELLHGMSMTYSEDKDQYRWDVYQDAVHYVKVFDVDDDILVEQPPVVNEDGKVLLFSLVYYPQSRSCEFTPEAFTMRTPVVEWDALDACLTAYWYVKSELRSIISKPSSQMIDWVMEGSADMVADSRDALRQLWQGGYLRTGVDFMDDGMMVLE